MDKIISNIIIRIYICRQRERERGILTHTGIYKCWKKEKKRLATPLTRIEYVFRDECQ